MKVKAGTSAKDIFKNPDLYAAVSTAVTKCIADMQDPSKDARVKRQVKISLVLEQTERPGVYDLQARVAPVLAPTLCKMEDQQQMSITDFDPVTGEVKPQAIYRDAA